MLSKEAAFYFPGIQYKGKELLADELEVLMLLHRASHRFHLHEIFNVHFQRLAHKGLLRRHVQSANTNTHENGSHNKKLK